MEKTIGVNCPHCKTKLHVRIKPEYHNKKITVTCKTCGKPVSFKAPWYETSEDTQVNNQKPYNPNDTVTTQLNKEQKYKLQLQASVNGVMQVLEINQPYMSCGRTPETAGHPKTDLSFITKDYAISRSNHCVFRKYPNGVTIERVHINGISINQQRIKNGEEIFLKNGDIIKLGDSTFLFTISD